MEYLRRSLRRWVCISNVVLFALMVLAGGHFRLAEAQDNPVVVYDCAGTNLIGCESLITTLPHTVVVNDLNIYGTCAGGQEIGTGEYVTVDKCELSYETELYGYTYSETAGSGCDPTVIGVTEVDAYIYLLDRKTPLTDEFAAQNCNGAFWESDPGIFYQSPC